MNNHIYTIKKYKDFVWLLFLLLMVALRLPGIEQFVVTDEAAWLPRSANFYYALGQREFSHTYLNTPGVTVMWLGALAFFIKYPQYRGTGWGYFEEATTFHRFMHIYAPSVDLHTILVTARVLTTFANMLMFTLAIFILQKLFGMKKSLFLGFWVGIGIVYLGYTRLAHLDGLQSTGMFLSYVAMWVFLVQKEKKRIVYLILSSVSAAISILTRLPGILIIPMIGLGILATKKFRRENWLYFLLWPVITLLTIFLLWPALWETPSLLIQHILGPIINLTNESISMSSKLISGQSSWTYWLRYWNAFLWRSTPATLIGLVLFVWLYIVQKGILGETKYREFSLYVLVNSVIYMAIMTFPSKCAYRYATISFMSFDLLAAFGFIAAWQYLKNKAQSVKWAGVFLIFLIAGSAIYSTYPYYINYYTPLLGGAEKASHTQLIGYGEGLDQAARYLASKDHAEDLTVLSWYGYGSFSYFFPGTTLIIPTGAVWTEKFKEQLMKSDYLVVYINQWQRNIPPKLFDILEKINAEKTISINGVEYVRIYNVDNFRDILLMEQGE